MSECGVLSNAIEVTGAPIGIRVAIEVSDSGRVIQKLMTAHNGKAYEIRQVLFKNLVRVL